jgi:hypothetical protein
MRLKGLNTTGLQKVDDPSLPEPSGWLSDDFDEYSLCQNVACSASVQPVFHFQAFDPAEVFLHTVWKPKMQGDRDHLGPIIFANASGL